VAVAADSGGALFDPAAPVINRFVGAYRFLSNFYACDVRLDDDWYPTVEHAYQAAKFFEPAHRWVIQSALTPGKARRLGRSAQLRPDWDNVRLVVMEGLLRQKFWRGTAPALALRARLLATYPSRLVETNSWGDVFWGVCDGVGENHLGRLLMEIREENRRADSEWVRQFDWIKV